MAENKPVTKVYGIGVTTPSIAGGGAHLVAKLYILAFWYAKPIPTIPAITSSVEDFGRRGRNGPNVF